VHNFTTGQSFYWKFLIFGPSLPPEALDPHPDEMAMNRTANKQILRCQRNRCIEPEFDVVTQTGGEENVRNKNLEKMSVDELWNLHEEIRSVLSTKLDAEKRQLERRLVQLNGRAENKPKTRRPYPEVHPKYRNPERPSETWSGRGKRPRWVDAQLRSGKKVDELLIAQTH